jgi:hypothetical protein
MAKIICLANSYKGGGERCIAGIDPDTGKWIRPVSNKTSRAIPCVTRLVDGKEPQVLDILEIPIEDFGPDEGCQPENRLLKPGKWQKVSRITPQDLLKYCEDDSVILHNHQKSVLPDFFTKLPKSKWRSLQLVHEQNVKFIQDSSDPNKWRDKWRVSFRDGKGYILDLKLTDPLISDRLRKKENISNNCILTVSLGTPWRKRSNELEECYKMVAGVVELQP